MDTRFSFKPAQMAGVCLGARRSSSSFHRFPPTLPSATACFFALTKCSRIFVRFQPGNARGLKLTPSLFCCGCGRDSSSCSCSLAGRKLPLVLTLKIICSARRGFRYYAGVMTRQMSNQRSYGSCC